MFQVTPNTQNYQARYIITHPATGDFNCAAGQKYLQDLKARRKKELRELTALTGTNINNWQDEATAKNDEEKNVQAQYATLLPQVKDELENKRTMPAGIILFGVAMLGGAGFMRWKGMI
jgi:polyhydroxyalkanoate synthesis regulator phasin